MGGGLKNDEQVTVVMEIDGPLDQAKLDQFNVELRALMTKYGVKKQGNLKWKK